MQRVPYYKKARKIRLKYRNSMKKSHFTRNLLCILVASLIFLFSGCDLLLQITPPTTQDDPAVYIYQSEITLEVGKTVQLLVVSTAGDEVEWMSLDETVATVEDGLVTAVGVGETQIFAIGNKAQTSCVVKVTEASAEQGDPDDGTTPPDDPDVGDDGDVFILVIDALTLKVGESVLLKATSQSGDEISWTSSSPQVATVDDGLVTAVAEGVTKITASTEKVSANCKVTVVKSDDDGGSKDDPVVDPDDGSKKDGYTLVWRDEFDGTALDENKWGYQLGVQDQYGSSTGPIFWGNDELQYYTKDAVTVKDGSLVITATKTAMPDGRSYSSARILTRDKASWTYGYFEARMKTPTGNGMWPAFWMLPQPTDKSNSNNLYGSWPASGEIDIMEAKGRLRNVIDTTLHYGGAWYEHEMSGGSTTLSSDTDEWHTYAVEWTSDRISWYIDGKFTYFVTKSMWWSQDRENRGQSMPFDQPFYILLNLAVGGQYDGGISPDDSFTSASMYVDYVRVYKKN